MADEFITVASNEMDKSPEVEDISVEEDQGISNAKYQINSYGADYTVDGLVQRIRREDIYIPDFQRKYVWKVNQASSFIESLLLGLPVPGIFLSKDEDRRLVVIDGQQRLKSLERFYSGLFDDKRFALQKVRDDLLGVTYSTLKEEDRRQLDDSIIHATIIEQVSPKDDDSSIYRIFERLNTGATLLQSQEIRASVYHGHFINMLGDLNEFPAWRIIYGTEEGNQRRKDQELILRFLALHFMGDKYEKPLNEFLNKFTRIHRELDNPKSQLLAPTFISTITAANEAIGRTAFRSKRILNAAVFDSMMVGLARRLEQGPIVNLENVKLAHDELIQDSEYVNLYSGGTTDERNVAGRIQLATEAFKYLE